MEDIMRDIRQKGHILYGGYLQRVRDAGHESAFSAPSGKAGKADAGEKRGMALGQKDSGPILAMSRQ